MARDLKLVSSVYFGIHMLSFFGFVSKTQFLQSRQLQSWLFGSSILLNSGQSWEPETCLTWSLVVNTRWDSKEWDQILETPQWSFIHVIQQTKRPLFQQLKMLMSWSKDWNCTEWFPLINMATLEQEKFHNSAQTRQFQETFWTGAKNWFLQYSAMAIMSTMKSILAFRWSLPVMVTLFAHQVSWMELHGILRTKMENTFILKRTLIRRELTGNWIQNTGIITRLELHKELKRLMVSPTLSKVQGSRKCLEAQSNLNSIRCLSVDNQLEVKLQLWPQRVIKITFTHVSLMIQPVWLTFARPEMIKLTWDSHAISFMELVFMEVWPEWRSLTIRDLKIMTPWSGTSKRETLMVNSRPSLSITALTATRVTVSSTINILQDSKVWC